MDLFLRKNGAITFQPVRTIATFAWEDEDSHKGTSDMIHNNQTQIRTGYLLNTTSERYCCTKRLGVGTLVKSDSMGFGYPVQCSEIGHQHLVAGKGETSFFQTVNQEPSDTQPRLSSNVCDCRLVCKDAILTAEVISLMLDKNSSDQCK